MKANSTVRVFLCLLVAWGVAFVALATPARAQEVVPPSSEQETTSQPAGSQPAEEGQSGPPQEGENPVGLMPAGKPAQPATKPAVQPGPSDPPEDTSRKTSTQPAETQADQTATEKTGAEKSGAEKSPSTRPNEGEASVPDGGDSDIIQRVEERQIALARMRKRAAGILRNVGPFTSEKSLLDNLYYPLFDRPRRRATLAVLIKVSQILNEEISAHRRARGEVPLETLGHMLTWCEEALGRLGQPEDVKGLPHRLRVNALQTSFDARTFQVAGEPVCLIGWRDESRRALNPNTFDLDLLACLGVRIYALSPYISVTESQRQAILDWCEALGIGFVDRVEELGVPQSLLGQVVDTVPVAAPTKTEVARIAVDLNSAVLPTELLASRLQRVSDWPEVVARLYGPSVERMMVMSSEHLFSWDEAAWPAIMDHVADSRMLSSLATRSAVLGATGCVPLAATRWRIPSPPGQPSPTPEQWRAAMWAHLLAGQRIGFLDGWSEPRSDKVLPFESVFLFPELLETAAHTALEVQRLSYFLSAFPPKRDLAVVVGASGFDADRQTWSDEFLSFYGGLLDRQLNPVLFPAGAIASKALFSDYRAVVLHSVDGVSAMHASRFESLWREGRQVIAWGTCLTRDETGQSLPEIRLSNSFAAGTDAGELLDLLEKLRETVGRDLARFSLPNVRVDSLVLAESAPMSDGRFAVGIVNWSAEPTEVRVDAPSVYGIKTYRDLLTGRKCSAKQAHEVEAWGVRLLISDETATRGAADK